MKRSCNVATLIERYFSERLMRQRNVSGKAATCAKKSPASRRCGQCKAPHIGGCGGAPDHTPSVEGTAQLQLATSFADFVVTSDHMIVDTACTRVTPTARLSLPLSHHVSAGIAPTMSAASQASTKKMPHRREVTGLGAGYFWGAVSL